MTLTITLAMPDDCDALAVLARETFTHTFGHLYHADSLADHLAETCSPAFFSAARTRGNVVQIAREGGKMVGYVKYGDVHMDVAHDDADAELHRLYVLATHHSKGIGRALMAAALADPRLAQAPHLYIMVWEHNVKAQRFYARHGFQAVGETVYRVGDHADREIIMRREKQTSP